MVLSICFLLKNDCEEVLMGYPSNQSSDKTHSQAEIAISPQEGKLNLRE
jgi:hypothetical protein